MDDNKESKSLWARVKGEGRRRGKEKDRKIVFKEFSR